jgi:hypothetical protein
MITLIDFNGNPFDYCYTKEEVIAMFEELKSEIEDTGAYEQETQGKTEFLKGLDYSLNLIQQKINDLREG